MDAMARPDPAVPPALLVRIEEIWHPLEVWLFGSRARGDARPESDWDLVVVVPDGTREELLDLNGAWLRVCDLNLPVDLFPIRRGDFQESRQHFGSLSNIVTTEGKRVDAN